MMSNSADRYGTVSRTLHWLMAALIIALIFVGLYMGSLPDDDPSHRKLVGMHKAMGSLVLMLAVIRLIWIRISPAPALPDAFAAGEKRLTKGIQSLLYLLMVLVPLAGYVMSSAAGRPISFFGLFDLPLLIAKNKDLAHLAGEAHEILAFSIAGLILLHMAGAIKHRVLSRGTDKDILGRML